MPSIRNLQPAANDCKLWFISCLNSSKMAFYCSSVRILEIKGYVDYFNNKSNYGDNNYSAQNVVSARQIKWYLHDLQGYMFTQTSLNLSSEKVHELNKNIIYQILRILIFWSDAQDYQSHTVIKIKCRNFFQTVFLDIYSFICDIKLAVCPCNYDIVTGKGAKYASKCA